MIEIITIILVWLFLRGKPMKIDDCRSAGKHAIKGAVKTICDSCVGVLGRVYMTLVSPPLGSIATIPLSNSDF